MITLELTPEEAALVASAIRNQRVGMVNLDTPLPAYHVLTGVLERLTPRTSERDERATRSRRAADYSHRVPERDPQDLRPEQWSPDPKLVMVAPADLRFQLCSDPATNRLYVVQMLDCNGELLATFSILDEVDDEIILTDPREGAEDARRDRQ
jgi:hypothetical protein